MGDALEPIAEFQGVLAEMKRRDVAGESFRAIGAWLNGSGRAAEPRPRMVASTVRAVLRSAIVLEAAQSVAILRVLGLERLAAFSVAAGVQPVPRG